MREAGGFQRVVRQTGIYALGNIAVKASGLILAPLYLNTTLLPADAYGRLILLEATAQIAIPVAGLGLATGMLRFMSEPEEKRPSGIGFTTLVLTVASAAAAFAILWAAAPALGGFLLDDRSNTLLPRLIAGYAALKVIGTVPYMLLRVRERAGWYVVSLAAEWTILVAGVYYFLAVERMGLEGVLVAFVASAAASALAMSAFMLAEVEWRFNRRLVRQLLVFGIPLVLSAFAGLLLNVGDRYILKVLTDAESVGLYGWASRLGGTINMLFVQSFQLAFTVIGLKTIGTGDRSLYRRTFRHYTIWTGWAVLGLSLLAYDLTLLLVEIFDIDPYYLGADVMVLPIALGFMGYGVYIVVNNVLYATNLTHVISMNVAVAAGVNVALNFALIPFMGALGAAIATALSYALLAGLSARIAERKIRVGYPWRILGIVIGIVLALYLVGRIGVDWEPWPRLALRAALIAAYLPLILASGLYTREDIRKGIQWLRGWRRGLIGGEPRGRVEGS